MEHSYNLKYPVNYYFEHADLLTEDDGDDLMYIVDMISLGCKIIQMQDYINSVRPWYRGKIDFKYAYEFVK
jgi:hypothetical protein